MLRNQHDLLHWERLGMYLITMSSIPTNLLQKNTKVAEKHRSFLQFLWWKDSDVNKSIVDHEMRVHVFGGVSSPSCSNYVLRKTVQRNQEEYGKDAPETLRRSFYLNDLLNSVNTR